MYVYLVSRKQSSITLLYFVSPLERPWRQRVFQRETLVTARAICVFSRVQKGTLGLTHEECVLQRVSLDALSDVTVVLGMRQSIDAYTVYRGEKMVTITPLIFPQRWFQMTDASSTETSTKYVHLSCKDMTSYQKIMTLSKIEICALFSALYIEKPNSLCSKHAWSIICTVLAYL